MARPFLCYLLDGPEHGAILMRERHLPEIKIIQPGPMKPRAISEGPVVENYRTGTYRQLGQFADADSGETYKAIYVWEGWAR